MIKPRDMTKDQLVELVERILLSVYGSMNNEDVVMLDPDVVQDDTHMADVCENLHNADLTPCKPTPLATITDS